MGNCIKKQPAVQSDGDDWVSPVTLYENKSFSGGYSGNEITATTTEVKIKISKKQLEELLGKTDVQGLTVAQVLARLMNVSDRFESNQRSWRPALHSIPE
ncbi:hypothetical protein HanRHA438_Chr03g0129311 [Helianthus annuus]|uniref:Uncharacterized protein n=1 Tax=Helianthus annuus TaxID=4232 RepID=A0A9K3JGX9_HELAN|nr:hypothetical protein HanXRQr2_Chr03g0117461 [Helianthus annuus]KAJ0593542.1 hypothetical protein HanHA300_Chr03g0098141 [Helianthus annuus]KAJ0601459.1 hypothetical protein HanIR_Chr03g0128581 [Helianthus annuus]KAJ0608554.1 hypothetical protein HanHA89_Chr03g0109861 [Helianthus annuus]KAJ0768620.1 hypothetical protein HanLR1_Chr03g0103231 [Helianthus annuus]